MHNVELPGTIWTPSKTFHSTYSIEGPPSCLHLFYNDGGDNGDEVLYGTSDGKIGLMKLTRQVSIENFI